VGKQILNRTKRTLSILLVVVFIAFVTITVSVVNCWDGTSMPSSIKNKFTDIAYATKSETQKLDIYLPNEGQGPLPVIIAFHGGGFTAGNNNREHIAQMLQGLNNGYAVVPVDYRLSGEAKFPAAINDAKAAIRFIKVNAVRYNLNPNKIALWGISAGGNLAALAGTTGGTNNCYDTSLGNANVSDNVTAVVDWCGFTNFSIMDKQFKESGIQDIIQGVPIYNTEASPPSQYLGQNISKVPDLCKQADPTTYITSECPPFLIQHGTLDPLVPTQQSVDLAAAITKKIGQDKVILTLLDGVGHWDPESFDNAENICEVFAFLDEYMKEGFYFEDP
jgi:acetyl esterase/lipase